MTGRPATFLGRALIAGSGAGAILVAATVPFLGRYGWDRDELYFMSASHHLALGYVDFPPVTAWVAWLVRALAGDSLDGLRVVSLACGVATVILVALMARELGGGFAAQFGGAAVWGADTADPRLGEHLPPDLVRPARLGCVPIPRDADPRAT
jgi:hypothetical protein